jgi:hypothetical protein
MPRVNHFKGGFTMSLNPVSSSWLLTAFFCYAFLIGGNRWNLRTNKTIAEPPTQSPGDHCLSPAGLSREDSRGSTGSHHGDAGSYPPKKPGPPRRPRHRSQPQMRGETAFYPHPWKRPPLRASPFSGARRTSLRPALKSSTAIRDRARTTNPPARIGRLRPARTFC